VGSVCGSISGPGREKVGEFRGSELALSKLTVYVERFCVDENLLTIFGVYLSIRVEEQVALGERGCRDAQAEILGSRQHGVHRVDNRSQRQLRW
jgi:hypothetical protein